MPSAVVSWRRVLANGMATQPSFCIGEKREAFLSGALARPFFPLLREGGRGCVVNKGSAPEYDVEEKSYIPTQLRKKGNILALKSRW